MLEVCPLAPLIELYYIVFHVCVFLNRAEKTEVLSDDLLQVNMTLFSSFTVHVYIRFKL